MLTRFAAGYATGDRPGVTREYPVIRDTWFLRDARPLYCAGTAASDVFFADGGGLDRKSVV